MISDSPARGKKIHRLTEKLRHGILEGLYAPDAPLPSLRDLAQKHDVSVRAIQGAIATLEAEGLVFSRKRRGIFVRDLAHVIVPSSDSDASQLRCVNFVERPGGTLPDFIRSSYMRGYTEALEHLDVKMRVVNCPLRDDDINAIAATLFSPLFPFQQQGCVLVNIVDARLIQWLNEREIPFVIQCNTSYDRNNLPPHHSVVVNKFAGGMAAVRHLMDLGHERIGYIGHCEHGTTPLYRGYEAGMCEAGPGVLDEDVLELDDVRSVYEALNLFLERPSRPTAIVAENDAVAMDTIEVAIAMGLKIPHDLSVTGYDDQDDASTFEPPLTTISNRRFALARSAVKLLFEVIAGMHEIPRRQILQPRLIERASTTAFKPRI